MREPLRPARRSVRPALAALGAACACIGALSAAAVLAGAGDGRDRSTGPVGAATAGEVDRWGEVRLLDLGRRDPLLASRIAPVTVHGTTRDALRGGYSVVSEVGARVPEDAYLDLYYGVAGPPGPADPPIFRFSVVARSGDGAVVPVFQAAVRTADDPRRRWRHSRVPLASLAGREVRLSLSTSAIGTGRAENGAFVPLWGDPRIVAPRDRDPRPDILILVIDTLRADRVGAYGYGRPTTPEVDRLAREGTLYEDATSQAPWTAPSISALMTGRYPHVPPAGHLSRADWIDPAVTTLAEYFSRAGYRSSAFANNPQVSPHLGFAAGFDRFSWYDTDHEAVEAASEDLGSATARPRFDYVHLLGPHVPYYLATPFSYRMGTGEFTEAPVASSRTDLAALGSDPAQVARVAAAYDSMVARTDALVGDLLDALRASGREGRTVVALTADHGEEFGEHGGWEHGHSLHRELLHVPLIVRYPRRFPAGSRVTQPVEQFSLMPTLLALAGVRPKSPIQADPLPMPGEPPRDPPDCRFAGSLLYGDAAMTVECEDGKAIWTLAEQPTLRLYATRTDREERADLAGDAPGAGTIGTWTERLARHYRDLKSDGWVLRVNPSTGGPRPVRIDVRAADPLVLLSVRPALTTVGVETDDGGRRWRFDLPAAAPPIRLALRGAGADTPVGVRARERRWWGRAALPLRLGPAEVAGRGRGWTALDPRRDVLPRTGARTPPAPEAGLVRAWFENEIDLPTVEPFLVGDSNVGWSERDID